MKRAPRPIARVVAGAAVVVVTGAAAVAVTADAPAAEATADARFCHKEISNLGARSIGAPFEFG